MDERKRYELDEQLLRDVKRIVRAAVRPIRAALQKHREQTGG